MRLRPGANEDFFALGGHSLSLMRLSYQLNEVFGVELGVGDLFRNSTVAAQAQMIEGLALDAFGDLSDEEFEHLVSTDL
ncbi:phosphopantetheine-binding protein [Streptomyces sp. NPDC088923]|uniref:phosphopantetheine-binding protein n=1 Tax=Streptomyces sp. NPDC088923 TaxID=3365913 RepID=UPI0037F29266